MPSLYVAFWVLIYKYASTNIVIILIMAASVDRITNPTLEKESGSEYYWNSGTSRSEKRASRMGFVNAIYPNAYYVSYKCSIFPTHKKQYLCIIE